MFVRNANLEVGPPWIVTIGLRSAELEFLSAVGFGVADHLVEERVEGRRRVVKAKASQLVEQYCSGIEEFTSECDLFEALQAWIVVWQRIEPPRKAIQSFSRTLVPCGDLWSETELVLNTAFPAPLSDRFDTRDNVAFSPVAHGYRTATRMMIVMMAPITAVTMTGLVFHANSGTGSSPVSSISAR